MAFLTLRGVKGSKLTISETDGNFLYLQDLAMSGGSTLIELTYVEAISLLVAEEVVEGARYLITGVDADLYGGTDVLVYGMPNGKFSSSGRGRFYNPRYDVIDVWNIDTTYSLNNLVIFGGKVWKNLTVQLVLLIPFSN